LPNPAGPEIQERGERGGAFRRSKRRSRPITFLRFGGVVFKGSGVFPAFWTCCIVQTKSTWTWMLEAILMGKPIKSITESRNQSSMG
jgi:hypothetical protein